MGITLDKITHTRPVYNLYPDLTDMVIDVLTPSIRGDLITIKDCVIYGKKRSGKTYLEKSLAERIVQHYGEDKVNVYISDSFASLVGSLDTPTRKCPKCGKWILNSKKCGDCGEELERLKQNKNVHVLIVDDPLRRYLSRGGTTREQRDAIGDFEAIAHKLEDKLNTKKGVGIIIIGSQQYKGLEKTFRDAVVTIFKTTMGEDQRYIENYLLRKLRVKEKLYKITDDIYVKDEHDRRSESVVLIGDQHEGRCVFPPCNVDYAVDVGEKETLRYKKKGELISDMVRKIKESGILEKAASKTRSTFRGVIAGFLMSKYPDLIDDVRRYVPHVCDKLAFEKYKKEEESEESVNRDVSYGDYRLKEDGRAFVWDYYTEKPYS